MRGAPDRCDYSVVSVDADQVFLIDLNQGGRSVTNDAEHVTREVAGHYGTRRIVYRDSMGRWDELRHRDGRFLGFAPWQGEAPSR